MPIQLAQDLLDNYFDANGSKILQGAGIAPDYFGPGPRGLEICQTPLPNLKA